MTITRHLLVVALTLFIICGFTVTPIAAANYSKNTDMTITVSNGPNSVTLYSNATAKNGANQEEANTVSRVMRPVLNNIRNDELLLAPITDSLRTSEDTIATAADAIEFFSNNPNLTATYTDGRKRTTLTADDAVMYMKKHPEFVATGHSQLRSTLTSASGVATADIDDVEEFILKYIVSGLTVTVSILFFALIVLGISPVLGNLLLAVGILILLTFITIGIIEIVKDVCKNPEKWLDWLRKLRPIITIPVWWFW